MIALIGVVYLWGVIGVCKLLSIVRTPPTPKPTIERKLLHTSKLSCGCVEKRYSDGTTEATLYYSPGHESHKEKP